MHRHTRQRQKIQRHTMRSQNIKLRFTAWMAGAAALPLVLPLALVIALVIALAPGQLQASPSDIQLVVFSKGSGGSWSVDVTIRHPDTGWDHYTNVWVVETLKGKELSRRVLFHPHEDEQPFTRSDTVKIPSGMTKVQVRAGEKPGGMMSNTVIVDLTRRKGDRFIVR